MSEASAAKRLIESFVDNQKARTSGESQAPRHKREITTPQFKAIGVLYAKVTNGVVSFEVFYEPHIEQVVKEEIASRFGAGAHEWRVT